MSKKDVHNGVPARFWVAIETDETVDRIAQGEGRSKSAVYRDLIEKGLIAGGYRSGSYDLSTLVREAVESAMKPQTDRLAAISAKAAQISAAAFFLAAYSGKLVLPPELQADFNEVSARARKLGVEYLKLSKDKSLDDFIGGGLRRMEESL